MIPQPVVRLYKVADAYIIQFAKTLRGFFMHDQAVFVARDPSFDTPYESDWLNAIDAAEAQDDDETMDDRLTEFTADVEAEMKACRITFQDAKPFIKKAFPNKPGRWNEFGFDNYDTVRQSQPLMIQFMARFHAAATRYSAELLAVNFTQTMIDEIAIRRKELNIANDAQEDFKGQMRGATEQRVITLNAMYGFCTTVCETGKLVMRDSYAGYQRYLLPASDEAPGVMALVGQTASTDASGELVRLDRVTVTILELGLSTTTDSNGNYGFGRIPAGTYTLRFSKEGFADHDMAGVVVTSPKKPATASATLTPTP